MDIELAGHGGDVGFEMGSGSSSGGYGGGMHLGWEDLSVVLPNFGKGPTKKLLRGLSGYAVPGHLLAIMGPSGSGKSTLLDSLAGRLSGKAIMTGKVHLNGRKRLDYGDVAYVTQEDVLLGTLTVRETLTYSAKLRLPTTMSNEDVIAIVEGTIMEMGLYDCADRVIGNWHLRGVSGGEKKRVSIALEVLTRPLLLFLDEPTSGLDTASAFFVTHTLKNVACDGRTVISSLHQPSSEVFELFDDLFLLSGGECVYFGEAKMAAEFFAEVGFPCPRKRSPSDHFMRCINSDFDSVTPTIMIRSPKYDPREPDRSSDPLENMATSEVKAKLVEKYRWSDYAQKAKAKMKEISILQGLVLEESRQRSKPGWWVQLWTLTGRSSVNMSRDIGYYWLRLGFYIVLSLGVGTIYFDVGTTYSAITARVACDGFVAGFMTLMSIGGFPSFIEEMKIFHRERLNGHYGVAVYILSNFLSSFPFLVAISICTGTITSYMAKLRTEFSHYVFFILNILASIGAVESGMMVIASLVPNFLVGIISGAGFIGIMMMAAGFFRLLPDLPKPFWRYPISYLSYASWAVQGTYKNDLLGLEFDPLVPGHPKLKGEDIVKDMFGIPMDHSKWWDLTALAVIVTFYRTLFILILKFKERASPMFRTIRARRALHHLSKRASFRKGPSFPSLRHNPLPSLSSQEGLNSPMH